MKANALFCVSLVFVVSGCVLEPEQSGPCELPVFSVVTGPLNEENGITRETGRSIPALVRLTNQAHVELAAILPDKPVQSAAPSQLDQFVVTTISGNTTLKPNETLFALVEFNGRFGGEYPPFELRASLVAPSGRAVDCFNEPSASAMYTFVGEYQGETAEAGLGTQVLTAGFWTNGTLFYTNIDRVHNDTRIPRAGWYEFENGDPLPVYVYNSSRAELPPRYNRSGYVTTIPGFNDALKGLSVSGSKVTVIPPELAYTRPGNEAHDLYGDEIVFYIEIRDVVAVDCPYPQPVCEAPAPPPVSHAAKPVSTPGLPV